MFCRVLNSITSSGAGVHIPARPLGLGAHIASPWGSVPAPGIGPRPAGRSPSGKAGAAADAEDPSRTQREELKWEMGKPSRKRGAWSPAAGAKRVAAQRDRLWSCLQASCDRQHTGLPAALSGQRDVPCAVSWRQNAGPPWLAPRTDRTGDQPGEERGRRARGRPAGRPPRPPGPPRWPAGRAPPQQLRGERLASPRSLNCSRQWAQPSGGAGTPHGMEACTRVLAASPVGTVCSAGPAGAAPRARTAEVPVTDRPRGCRAADDLFVAAGSAGRKSRRVGRQTGPRRPALSSPANGSAGSRKVGASPVSPASRRAETGPHVPRCLLGENAP